MTSKPKRATGKGKKAAAADKAETAREPPEASEASEASEESTDHTEAQEQNGKAGNKKPSEAQAEAMAEQLVAQARKPMKKNDSQSSLAGSVTVSADPEQVHEALHCRYCCWASLFCQFPA